MGISIFENKQLNNNAGKYIKDKPPVLTPAGGAEAGMNPSESAQQGTSTTTGSTLEGISESLGVTSSSTGGEVDASTAQQAQQPMAGQSLGLAIASGTSLNDRLRASVANAINTVNFQAPTTTTTNADGTTTTKAVTYGTSQTGVEAYLLDPTQAATVKAILADPMKSKADKLNALLNSGIKFIGGMTPQSLLDKQEDLYWKEQGKSQSEQFNVNTTLGSLAGTDIDLNSISSLLGMPIESVKGMTVFQLQESIDKIRNIEQSKTNQVASENQIKDPVQAAEENDENNQTVEKAKEAIGTDTITMNINGVDQDINIKELLENDLIRKDIIEFFNDGDVTGLPKQLADKLTGLAKAKDDLLGVQDVDASRNQSTNVQFDQRLGGQEDLIEELLGKQIPDNLSETEANEYLKLIDELSGQKILSAFEITPYTIGGEHLKAYSPEIKALYDEYEMLKSKKGKDFNFADLESIKARLKATNASDFQTVQKLDRFDDNGDNKFNESELAEALRRDPSFMYSLDRNLMDALSGGLYGKILDEEKARKERIAAWNNNLTDYTNRFGEFLGSNGKVSPESFKALVISNPDLASTLLSHPLIYQVGDPSQFKDIVSNVKMYRDIVKEYSRELLNDNALVKLITGNPKLMNTFKRTPPALMPRNINWDSIQAQVALALKPTTTAQSGKNAPVKPKFSISDKASSFNGYDPKYGQRF